jgi:FkbM family methyltransferase
MAAVKDRLRIVGIMANVANVANVAIAVVALRLPALLRWWRRLRSWDPRLLWHRARFRRWNRGAGPGEMVVRPDVRLLVDARSREPFELFCWRSVEMTRELDGFLREMRTRRRFLDVGACHGIFSLAFAQGRPAARAVAVEPSAIAYAILAENVRLGGLRNVVARQVACGATAGTLRMRQAWHHLEALPEAQAAAAAAAQGEGQGGPVGGERGGGGGHGDGGGDPVVTVPMQSVDQLCAELDFQPDLVKIDVEGYELAVLAGARATLARYRPPLFLELHPRRLGELGGSVAEVVELLAALSYGFHSLGGAPLRRGEVVRRKSVLRIMAAAIPGPRRSDIASQR